MTKEFGSVVHEGSTRRGDVISCWGHGVTRCWILHGGVVVTLAVDILCIGYGTPKLYRAAWPSSESQLVWESCADLVLLPVDLVTRRWESLSVKPLSSAFRAARKVHALPHRFLSGYSLHPDLAGLQETHLTQGAQFQEPAS